MIITDTLIFCFSATFSPKSVSHLRQAALSRGIKRCALIDYDATYAGKMYTLRRRNCRRKPSFVFGSDLYRYVYNRLCLRWSPQQISNRLRMMPDQNGLGFVSHETIYAAIYAQPRGFLKKEMLQEMRACLRQEKIKRGVRRKTLASKGGFVPETQRIVHRPEDINNRLIPGYWEGDFIKGAFN